MGDSLADLRRSSGRDSEPGVGGLQAQFWLRDLTRLYPNTAGHEVLPILREALLRCWPDGDFGQSELCVEMRSRLRSHLIQYLLRRLVTKHAAPPILRDALFGVDLGQ